MLKQLNYYTNSYIVLTPFITGTYGNYDGVKDTHFTDVSSMSLLGYNTVAAIGYEAEYNNTFGDANDSTIFQGNNPNGTGGYNAFEEWLNVDMSTAYFRSDGTGSQLALTSTPHVALEMYRLDQDVTLQYSDFGSLNGFFLPEGTIIIGYNDGWNRPSDLDNHDDLILAANPVPEPATMLLLGTGLVGLAGLGRKKFLKK